MTRNVLLAGALAAALALPSPSGSAPLPPPGTAEFRVNVGTTDITTEPAGTVFPDGGFLVAWTARGSVFSVRTSIQARFFDRTGRPVSGQLSLVDPINGSLHLDQVVADRDGTFLVAWTETRLQGPGGVYVRRFSRDGRPRGARIQVHDPSAADRFEAVLAVGPRGRFAVAWTSEVPLPDPAIYTNAVARIFSPAGVPLTGEIVVGQGFPGIGDDNGHAFPAGIAMGADNSLNVLVQRLELPDAYCAFLTHVPASRRPHETRLTTQPFCVPDGRGAALAKRPDGSLALAWSEWEAFVQRATPSGQPIGEAALLSRSVRGRQSPASVAALADGRYIVVWREDSRDGDGSGVFGRIFAADGTPVSRDLRINTTTAGHQAAPVIATHRGGPVVVVWQQSPIQFAPTDIYARLLPVPNP